MHIVKDARIKMPTVTLPQFLGPVLAATIAGAVAFLASVFSKELKTSEFRQAWIDSLRVDLAELISITLQLGDEIVVRHKRGESGEAIHSHLRTKEPEFQRLEACKARILLRLNPEEHMVLVQAVESMTDPPDHDSKAMKLITLSHSVLKAEWKRVKRGEPVFFITKWLSLAVFLTALAVTISIVCGKLSIQYVP